MTPGRVLAVVCAAAIVLSCLVLLPNGDSEQEEYAMFVSVDETKVSVISGNLTLAITHDSWPRMVFWHTVDPFSPTFDVGFPKIHLFNDSDLDGRFRPSEAVYAVYLDSNHAEWNLSSVESGVSPDLGEFVVFSMSAVVDAYNETLDAPPIVESWANVTFWFRLAENDLEYENPAGPHTVFGKTEVFVNMTLEVMNKTELGCVAIERFLQGGGAAYMFHVLEDGPGEEITAVLSARVDQSVEGENVTLPLNQTDHPTQCVDIAHENGTVQAFYHWGSAAVDLSGGQPSLALNSSCYTTGTGLVLHSVLPLSNGTLAFSLDSSVGIDESGFVGDVTDWMKEIGLALAVAAAAAVATVAIGLHVVLRRRRLRRGEPEEKEPEAPR
ncbi:MAG: hypothetical protein AB7S97_01400 [Thermoplasmata archaeon]